MIGLLALLLVVASPVIVNADPEQQATIDHAWEAVLDTYDVEDCAVSLKVKVVAPTKPWAGRYFPAGQISPRAKIKIRSDYVFYEILIHEYGHHLWLECLTDNQRDTWGDAEWWAEAVVAGIADP